jgi:hypothetical protein
MQLDKDLNDYRSLPLALIMCLVFVPVTLTSLDDIVIISNVLITN